MRSLSNSSPTSSSKFGKPAMASWSSFLFLFVFLFFFGTATRHKGLNIYARFGLVRLSWHKCFNPLCVYACVCVCVITIRQLTWAWHCMVASTPSSAHALITKRERGSERERKSKRETTKTRAREPGRASTKKQPNSRQAGRLNMMAIWRQQSVALARHDCPIPCKVVARTKRCHSCSVHSLKVVSSVG